MKLRPNYGQTENGFITVDTAPDDAIRPDCVGRAAPGIEVRIGDDPLDADPPGRLGRVWFKSPWYMEGYGFPPHLAPREGREGWWPTADVGVLDASGYLTLAGRADDCFKTSSGHLVNPGEIVQALTGHSGVSEVVVIPVRSPAGPVVGVLAEAEAVLDADQLRATAAKMLPSWLQPQVVAVLAPARDTRLELAERPRGSVLNAVEGPPDLVGHRLHVGRHAAQVSAGNGADLHGRSHRTPSLRWVVAMPASLLFRPEKDDAPVIAAGFVRAQRASVGSNALGARAQPLGHCSSAPAIGPRGWRAPRRFSQPAPIVAERAPP